jgi:hypothetical protein
MILWTNETTDKGKNYDVSTRLPVVFSRNDDSLGAVRPTTAQRDTRLRRLLAEAVAYWTSITIALVAIALLFALAPSLTGQAQEGQGRDWMGEKLSARSYQSPAREARR